MNNNLFRLSFLIAIPVLFLLAIASAQKETEDDFVKTIVTDGNSPTIAKILPISARRQWDNHRGYCVETCIQSFALYYGTYVSQYQARAMIDADQEHQVLVGHNEDVVLDKLQLAYERWDWQNQPTPQHKSYLGWVKRQLWNGHPVIGAVFMKGETDPDYDHTLSLIGFQSAHDANGYHDDDKLVFYDNYSSSSFSRPLSTLPASRSEANGGNFDYNIPEDYDYGCSVTGIVDPMHETVPVRLGVDRWDEPNAVTGQDPVILHGTVTIESLLPGKLYSLLRYDDFRKVPAANFLAKGGYTWRHQFTATASTQTVSDDFPSDACVIYRCIAE